MNYRHRRLIQTWLTLRHLLVRCKARTRPCSDSPSSAPSWLAQFSCWRDWKLSSFPSPPFTVFPEPLPLPTVPLPPLPPSCLPFCRAVLMATSLPNQLLEPCLPHCLLLEASQPFDCSRPSRGHPEVQFQVCRVGVGKKARVLLPLLPTSAAVSSCCHMVSLRGCRTLHAVLH